MGRATEERALVGLSGEHLGRVGERVETRLGTAAFVQRAEDLGGGMTVVPANQLEDRGEEIASPYGRLSMLEAPPYSANVPLTSYLRYWKRLGAGNINQDESSYLSTGSGPVGGEETELTDEEIAGLIEGALRAAPSVVANAIDVTVRDGTALLEGEQNDTPARLAAAQAAAGVRGVREIVNMIVVRAV
jgi:hypothetical protein